MTNETEEWRAMVSKGGIFVGAYEVSNLGRARSLRRQKVLNPVIWEGYRFLQLWKDGKRLRQSLHGAIIEAFKGPRPPGQTPPVNGATDER